MRIALLFKKKLFSTRLKREFINRCRRIRVYHPADSTTEILVTIWLISIIVGSIFGFVGLGDRALALTQDKKLQNP
ncbi:MAG TPA: hypothetical protein VLD84_09355, partial [Nitrososphaeraceae archaeon]|nr:hypothetical protein [Nitrososphaeraceae archaeon]